jgi:alpha-glucosidase (family GH31 glycosyl hydrolase)
MTFRLDTGSTVVLDGARVPLAVTVCERGIVRLRIGEPRDDGPPSFLPSHSWPPQPLSVAPHAIEGGGIACRLAQDVRSIEFHGHNGAAQVRLSLAAAVLRPQVRLRFRLIGEQHLYGLGHGGGSLDRLGTARRLWTCHVNHAAAAADIPIPLLLSNAGFGLFFDDPSLGMIRPGDSPDEVWIELETATGGLDFYYLAGEDLRAVLRRSALLLGRAPMPPRWALGFMQSSRHFEDSAEVRRLGETLRERQLPCDALIFLSTYGDGKGWNKGVGHLEFEPRVFAEAADMLAGFRERHLKVITHEYPVLHPDSPLYREAEARDYLLDDGYAAIVPTKRPSTNYSEGQRYIDFAQPEAARWWWEKHHHLLALGVAGWWLDGGEGPLPRTRSKTGAAGLHNRFDLLRQQAFAEGEARDRPGGRTFLLCRSGGAGMQRFGAGCWSGDINRTFATLEAQVGLGLNTGLSGVPWWGTDIGGFYPVTPPDGELFIRWFQFGAFTPIFRAHGVSWREHVPWAYGPEIEAICRSYLELRYRMMPYTYTVARQAHTEGLPLVRPLVLNDPDDPNAWECASEYLWGDDILVAPVTRAGARTWPVYLPRGVWHDFWTSERHRGPGAIEVAAPLDRLPLFVRGGAIVPMGPVVQHLDGHAPTALTLLVYPEGSSAFTLYEDDGETTAYLKGGHVETPFASAASSDEVVVRIGEPRGDVGMVPKGRSYEVRLFAQEPPRSVAVDADETHWRREGSFIVVRLAGHPAELRASW